MTPPRPSRATLVLPPSPQVGGGRVGVGGWLSWIYLVGSLAALAITASLGWLQNCTGVQP